MLIGCEGWWGAGRINGPAAFLVEQGRILRRVARQAGTPDLDLHLLIPALTDLQVNGGGGVLFNNDPTADGLRQIAAAHRALGTGGILPTVISDSTGVMQAAADAVLACRSDPGILGLHIEGPHFAPERRGTHAAEHIRPLDLDTVRLVERLRRSDVRVMITLAPEIADPGLFARLKDAGAVISAGHSSATADQTLFALEQGLSCFTHLYNAMPPMTSRAPGIVGAAINSMAAVGIIADGIHVSWDMIRIALRARPPGAVSFIVSDAMATVGGPDHFSLYGREIRLEGGVLRNDEGGLAGAHIDMLGSLRNLVVHVGLDLAEAITICGDAPRRVLGMGPQSVEPGTRLSDLLGLDAALTRVPLT